MGQHYAHKFLTQAAILRRNEKMEENKARKERWNEEKRNFASWAKWSAFDKMRQEGRKVQVPKREYFGVGEERRKPRSWVGPLRRKDWRV